MTVTWKKIAYAVDVLPGALSPYAVGDLIYAPTTTTLGKLADVAVGSYLKSGGVGAVPAWAALNQAAVAGLTTVDGPTFAHLHLSDVAAITMAAESWVGPSSTAGIYFKGGYVGIGTATPVALLHLLSATSFFTRFEFTSTAAFASFSFYENGGVRSFVQHIGSTHAFGATRQNNFELGSVYGAVTFTNNNIERMRIANNGIVTMSYYGAGTATFDAAGGISSVSDERLKTILRKYTGGIAQLNGIEPIVHKWNKKSGMEMDHEYVGFSAQNVQENMPEAVYENKDGYLSYSDKAVIAALVNTVKQQQAQIEALQAR